MHTTVDKTIKGIKNHFPNSEFWMSLKIYFLKENICENVKNRHLKFHTYLIKLSIVISAANLPNMEFSLGSKKEDTFQCSTASGTIQDLLPEK